MFQKATKAKSKLRLAIFAPAGGGKTFTALSLATGIGGPIAVIDTERGSASKYADRFEFDAAELEHPNIDSYIEYINGAKDYNVLIIDSLSHGWQELLQEVEKIAKAKYRGNTWSAWSEGTPKQRALVDTILRFPGHVIATMRSKTEWQAEKTSDGKSKPVRVGLAPEQGKGIEYEFDMLMEMSTEHYANIIKDRTGQYQDAMIEKPGEELGKKLAQWLDDGIDLIAEKEAGLIKFNERIEASQTDEEIKAVLDEGKQFCQRHKDKEAWENLKKAGTARHNELSTEPKTEAENEAV